MHRKLVKHGESTLMLSMPRTWINKNNLKKGDLIQIHEQDSNLLISPEHKKLAKRKTEIHVKTSNPKHLRNLFSHLYRTGVTEITVHYTDEKTFSAIHEVVSKLLGYEITEHSDNKCIIKNMIKELDFNYEEAFFKMKQLIESSFSLVKKSFTKKKVDEKHLEIIRNETWKMRNAALLLQSKDSLSQGFGKAYTIYVFEQNASFLLYLLQTKNKEKLSVSKNFIKLFEEVEKYFHTIKPIKKKTEEEYANSLKKSNLLRECEKLSAEGGDDAKLVQYLSMMIINIFNQNRIQ